MWDPSLTQIRPNPTLGTGHEANDVQSRQDAKRAAMGFEMLLINKVVEAMRATVPDSGMSGSNNEMQDYLVQEALTQAIAKNGGLGIGKMLLKHEPDLQIGAENDTQITVRELTKVKSGGSEPVGSTATALAPGETPLSELVPPSTDAWLGDPDAEDRLRAILLGGTGD